MKTFRETYCVHLFYNKKHIRLFFNLEYFVDFILQTYKIYYVYYKITTYISTPYLLFFSYCFFDTECVAYVILIFLNSEILTYYVICIRLTTSICPKIEKNVTIILQ